MILLASILVFLSITLLLGAFGSRMSLAPRRAAITRLRDLTPTTYQETLVAGSRPIRRTPRWWQKLLGGSDAEAAGDGVTVVGLSPDTPTARLLLHAGYRTRGTLRTYRLGRMTMALSLMALPLLVTLRSAVSPAAVFLMIAIGGLVGYMLPRVYLRIRARRRQHRMRLSLPDALDLLVVCVEAGMGLNQAIVRVSEELRSTHPDIAEEFRLVNLEIRAGRTRTEALRGLGERTGVDDIISLAAMIIQTDRFGTSIARSLRVHSDSLRTERRQRAEEAAAKTTIKLIFPLLFCIFPSLFVIILGPAAMHLWEIFGEAAR